LTDRTLLWRDLLREPINPLLGAGFESFWLGERIREIWLKWTFGPNQAHNGYLETYLNIGLIGLFMLIGLLVATYAKARRDLIQDFEWGRFRLGFLAASILYNWTEAAFKTVGFLFFLFYIIAIDLPKRQRTQIKRRGSEKLDLTIKPIGSTSLAIK
jgi:O-antigen ligase